MKTILYCFLFFLLISTILAVPITNRKTTKYHPASLRDYVATPGGYLHKSCVYDVGNNAKVIRQFDQSFFVTKEDGSHLYIPRCNYPRMMVDGDGWQVFAEWDAGKDLTDFNATWNVPTNPPTYNDQLLYTFSGLQNSFSFNGEQGVDIIQPVLQFGDSPAGGGAFWGIACWYVTSTGIGLHSKLQPATAGDSIFGVMTKPSASSSSWSIVATDTTSGVSTNLAVDKKLGEFEPYAFVTLEVYDVSDCTQYPTNPLLYTDLIIQVSNQPVTPVWKAQSQQVICKESCTVNSATAITIAF